MGKRKERIKRENSKANRSRSGGTKRKTHERTRGIQSRITVTEETLTPGGET